MTHQHAHHHAHPHAVGDVPDLPTTPAVRRGVLAVLVPLVLATVAGLVLLWPDGSVPQLASADRYPATILSVQPCAEPVGLEDATGDVSDLDRPTPQECEEAVVLLDDGPDVGAEFLVQVPFGEGLPTFAVGDAVVVSGLMDVPVDSRYELLDFQRDVPLLLLAGLFAVAVVALARWRGLAALAGLAITVLVLFLFVLPALLTGQSPLAVAVVGASVMMIVTLYLSHGVSIRTSVALIGTLVSLTLTGLIGAAFSAYARFTGSAEETAAYVGAIGVDVDLRGLLLAGLVIGALGVLDDVTVTQTAAVWEVARADPGLSRFRLWLAGMRIGRDHVAATVNTLVLAYAGASLPLLMIFLVIGQGPGTVVTSEVVATEVVRALAGGLGIIAAVPVTTALAAFAVREGARAAAAHRAEAVPA